eukprot:SAG11_NODE_5801_length_1461_cov_1.029369_2_plen_203_part_00
MLRARRPTATPQRQGHSPQGQSAKLPVRVSFDGAKSVNLPPHSFTGFQTTHPQGNEKACPDARLMCCQCVKSMRTLLRQGKPEAARAVGPVPLECAPRHTRDEFRRSRRHHDAAGSQRSVKLRNKNEQHNYYAFRLYLHGWSHGFVTAGVATAAAHRSGQSGPERRIRRSVCCSPGSSYHTGGVTHRVSHNVSQVTPTRHIV